MRTYNELTPMQKQEAQSQALTNLLNDVASGAIRFDDVTNQDNLQAKIDEAISEAESMQTPWFVGEILMESVGDFLRGMAQTVAKGALYPTPSELIIRLSS